MAVSAQIPADHWQAFLRSQRLPEAYRASAERWFMPLAQELVEQCTLSDSPVLVGINGCQGSGKSTLAAFLEMALPDLGDLRVAVLSIDDFYLTRAERGERASTWHPLFATRGVPGTHDTLLLARTLDELCAGGGAVKVPRFDKASDDRLPTEAWSHFDGAIDVVILEGWCVGIPPQPESQLHRAVNALEATEDERGDWRGRVNQALADQYQSLFGRMDVWVMLAAPDFDCVFRWRREQEAKLRDRHQGGAAGLMSDVEIARFIQFYQRLTEWALVTMPAEMDYCYRLDANRHIRSLTRRDKELC